MLTARVAVGMAVIEKSPMCRRQGFKREKGTLLPIRKCSERGFVCVAVGVYLWWKDLRDGKGWGRGQEKG